MASMRDTPTPVKSGAVMAAPTTATSGNYVTKQSSARAADSTAASMKTADVSTSGAQDLSSGDLTKATGLQSQLNDLKARQADEQRQLNELKNTAAKSTSAIANDTAQLASASAPSGNTASTSTPTGLSSILGSSTTRTVVIIGLVVGIGYYLYRRNKEGQPIFGGEGDQ